MKVSVKWFLMMTVVVAALLVFQTKLHSQSAGTVRWGSTSSGVNCSSACTTSVSWNSSFTVSYVATCTPVGASSNLAMSIYSQSGSSITLYLQDATGQQSPFSAGGFECIGVAT